jgi:hypothetical protein
MAGPIAIREMMPSAVQPGSDRSDSTTQLSEDHAAASNLQSYPQPVNPNVADAEPLRPGAPLLRLGCVPPPILPGCPPPASSRLGGRGVGTRPDQDDIIFFHRYE